jgi:hypothetical protein
VQSVADLLWHEIRGGVQLTLDYFPDVDDYDFDSPAETWIQWLCVATAISPHHASVFMDQYNEYYRAVIWTAQACGCNSSAIAVCNSLSLGASWNTEVCGGGVFNQSAIAAQEWVAPFSEGSDFFFRVCGAVELPNCPANSSVCFVDSGQRALATATMAATACGSSSSTRRCAAISPWPRYHAPAPLRAPSLLYSPPRAA